MSELTKNTDAMPEPSENVQKQGVESPAQLPNTKESDKKPCTFAELTLESPWKDFAYCMDARSFSLHVEKRKLQHQVGGTAGGKRSFGTGKDRWDKALLLIGLHAAHGIRGFAETSSGIKSVPNLLSTLKLLLTQVSGGQKAVDEYIKEMAGTHSSTVSRNRKCATRLLLAYKFGWLELSEAELKLLQQLEAGPANVVKRPPNEHQPLPDGYVSEFGKRAMWVLDNWLEPMANFLEFLDEKWGEKYLLSTVKVAFNPGTKVSSRVGVTAPIIEYLEKYPDLLPKPDFDLTWERVSRKGSNLLESYKADGTGRLLSAEGLMFWSEESIAQRYKNPEKKGGAFIAGIREQITIIQTCLFFMLALLTGARRSELGSVPSNRQPALLVENSHGAMLSTTYKLSLKAEGNEDLWVLPEYIAKHLQTFHRLAKHSKWFFPKRKDTGFLYLSEVGSAIPLVIGGLLKKDFDALAKAWGIDHLMDHLGLTDHRFRKTIARYVAACVNGGATMLFHLFKHRAWEMTLHYINTESMIECINSTDEELKRAGGFLAEMYKDVEKEAKECVVEQYVQFVDSKGGKYVGGGVKRIKEMHMDFIANKDNRIEGKRELNEQEIDKKWALQASEEGTALNRPSPGVTCTKLRNLKGECNRSNVSKAIEPTQCKSYCEFYIMSKDEAEALERKVQAQTQELIELLESPSSQDELRALVRPLAIGIRCDAERLKGVDMLPPSVQQNEVAMALIDAPEGQWMEALGL